MTLTRELLDTRYAWWFHNKRNAEQAKREILIIFSKELNDYFEWTEQNYLPLGQRLTNKSEGLTAPLTTVVGLRNSRG